MKERFECAHKLTGWETHKEIWFVNLILGFVFWNFFFYLSQNQNNEHIWPLYIRSRLNSNISGDVSFYIDWESEGGELCPHTGDYVKS